ncbi:MAG TPA: FimV/HubP family polar landmark protein [Usitatibacter sp.]|nr:FimV/HubP family polar landmark protein [Usitatibacter sp.]
MVTILNRGAVAALLACAAFAAQGAGLGKLTVNSALGQILNAEIDLVSLQPGELDSLSARVAAPEAFRDARIEYSPSLRLLRFTVDKRPNGQPYLKVSSIAPVNEPFVDALIEVTWPAGRVQREYPILLDPPGYAQGKVSPPTVAAAPPAPAATQNPTPPAAEPAATPSTPAPSSEPTGTPSAKAELPTTGAAPETTAGADTYGPVQKGETLHKIAEQVKPSTVSMEQMLVALYRENKSAFAGNNMNRLKTGQILKVPTAEQVAEVEAKDANHEIHAQVQDWNTYRESLSGGVASLPTRPESSNATSGRIASASVTPPPAPETPNQDVLKLSKSDSAKGGAAGKGGAGSQDRINALQEEVTSKDKALREAQSRVGDLEKQIRDMQRLLDLTKGGTATKAGEAPKVAAAPIPPPATVTPAPPVTPPAPVTPPKVATVEPTQPAATPTPAPTPAPTEAAKPPKSAEAPKPTPPATRKAAPPPKEWYEDIDPMYLAAGGLVVIGIPLIAFLLIRRRRNRDDMPLNSSMTSAFPSDLKPDTGARPVGGGLVDTGNSSFLTDFDKTGPGTIDTDEVDPVAEAEVYIAYGRDAQAEEILKEAMARDKNRHEIAVKLLEIYHARKSATAFETVAKELHTQVGDSSPLWQKAAAMGHQIDPQNALYAAAAGAGAAAFVSSPAPVAKPDVDFDIDSSKSAESSASPSFDLDLDSQKGGTGSAASDLHTEAASGLDFDLAPSGGAHAPADVAAEAPKEEKASFDFDLSGLDFPAKSGEAKPASSASSGGGLDLADLNLEPGPGTGGGSSEAVGTKLELAKAYLEIGDKDGAREILQEVAKEGSAAQREEAQRLIASL